MKWDFLKNEKLICFAAGAAAVIAGGKLAKSDKTREVVVSGIAKGMKLRDDAVEAAKNLKEDAEDLCYEAKSRLNNDETEEDEI